MNAAELPTVVSAPALVVADGQTPASVLDPAKPATTTSEQDRQTHGQRRINLLWETTQAVVAVSVTVTTLGVCAFLVTRDPGSDGAFLLLGNAFVLVIAMYFNRTNHTKTGGVTAAGDR